MESLKIIPQVFFDLFARVVPGSVSIVAYLLLFRENWESLVQNLMGNSFSSSHTSITFLIFLGTAFVMGELLSPIAKLLQRLTENKPFKIIEKENGLYDKLRFNHPYIGSLCAKIRAEFTMHNGLSAVFAMSAIYYPFSAATWHWYILVFLIFLAFITLIRGHDTNETFNKTVIKFSKAAGYEIKVK